MKKILFIPLVITFLAANMAFAADEIHWTFTGQNSVAFDWRGTTTEKTIGYGLTSGVYTRVTATTPNPVPVSSSGPFWEANLTGLTANTRYYYSIGNGPERSFRTPPAPGSSNFNVYALGNIGSTSTYFNTGAVQDIIANDLPSFVVGLGDLTLGSINGKATVDQHFNDVMVWSKEAAYMPVWGDLEWISSSKDSFKNYKGRFNVPNSQTSPGSPLAGGKDWYWFDYGNTRFITLPEPWSGAWAAWNTTAGALMAQAQADSNIKFIATFGHQPAYSSGHYSGSATLKGMLDTLGDTYSKYTLNVNGHSNNYERSLPQHGVTHVTVGTGGANLTQDGTCLWLTCAKPAWSAFRAMHLGALKLQFTGSSIVGSFICGPAGGGTNDVNCTKGNVVDNFTIGTIAPDVIVTSLSYANGVFTSTVKNQGNAATPAGVVIGVSYFVDGVYKTWGVANGPLAAGASVTIGTNGGAYTIPTGTHAIMAQADDNNRFVESNETNNELTASVVNGMISTTAPVTTAPVTTAPVTTAPVTTAPVTTAPVTTAPVTTAPVTTAPATTTSPDVIVTSLSYANGVFTSTVKNQGTAATPAGVVIGVGYWMDGVYKTWGAVNGPLAAGASVTIGTNGGAYTIPTGTHTIMAWADDNNRFAESNETNNQLTASVVNGMISTPTPTSIPTAPPPPPSPDLIVTSLSYDNGVFTSTVKNQGTAATPAGAIIDLGYSVDGIQQTSGTITGPLAAGASVTIGTTTPYTIPVGTHTIMAYADDVNSITESDETNNQLSQSITVADTQAPTAPNGLAAKTISSTQINLSWAASSDNVEVTGYKVFRNGSQISTSTTTAYSDSGLTAGTSYTYTIGAYDAAGNSSSNSAAVTAVTAVVAAAPTSNDWVVQGFAGAAGVTGGAGGQNIVVTNLNESGAGSLKAAIAVAGARNITFTPGLTGTINWTGLGYVNSPNMTIDGTGAKISISGMSLNIFTSSGTATHNVIIRNLTFTNTTSMRNSINVEYGSYGVWIDHNTFYNNSTGDEGQGVNIWNFSSTTSDGGEYGVTVSWNYFHAPNIKSVLVGSNTSVAGNAPTLTARVSVHHNWFTGIDARSPRAHGRGNLVHAWNNYNTGWSESASTISHLADFLAENNIYEATNGKQAVVINAYPTQPPNSVEVNNSSLLGGATEATTGAFPHNKITYAYTLETANDTLKTRIIQGAGAH